MTPRVDLLVRLTQTFEVTIITTNWDTHVEWIFEAQMPCILFNYGVAEITAAGKRIEPEGDVSLLKLHGCVNGSYCGCCQAGTHLEYGTPQAVTDYRLLLDPDDFRLLGSDAALTDLLQRNPLHERLAKCQACGASLA
jgi:hypothetical protein